MNGNKKTKDTKFEQLKQKSNSQHVTDGKN